MPRRANLDLLKFPLAVLFFEKHSSRTICTRRHVFQKAALPAKIFSASRVCGHFDIPSRCVAQKIQSGLATRKISSVKGDISMSNEKDVEWRVIALFKKLRPVVFETIRWERSNFIL